MLKHTHTWNHIRIIDNLLSEVGVGFLAFFFKIEKMFGLRNYIPFYGREVNFLN